MKDNRNPKFQVPIYMPILTIFKPHSPRIGHIADLIKFPEATPKKHDSIMDNTLMYVD